ncbi:BrnA antitoxin family protein [Pusillimonas sp.]|uniref:BrnA antitoxin family protein n=1 Tax=Pusillimonas sp. TaxID=3040095 RepID=UPI0037CB5C3E
MLVDAENPEWTQDMFDRAVGVEELPPSLQKKLRGRGPQRRPTKVATTVRFDPAIVEHFKAGGPGWQTRINDALKKAIDTGLA